MALVPSSAGISLRVQQAFARLSGWVDGLSYAAATPGAALDPTRMVDARLAPQAPMNNDAIDIKLLADLGSIGLKRGKLATAQSHPELMQAWQAMAARAGLPSTPQLIVCESDKLNALTLSKDEVAITTGLLNILTLNEAVAVLGHELGHAQSNHLTPRIATTTALSTAGIVLGNEYGRRGGLNATLSWLGHKADIFTTCQQRIYGKARVGQPSSVLGSLLYMGAAASVGGVIANHLTVRPTELDADRKGAAICGDPQALASALEKLKQFQDSNGWADRMHKLTSGYPSTQTRIDALKKLTVVTAPVLHKGPPPPQPGTQLQEITRVARVETPNQQVGLA